MGSRRPDRAGSRYDPFKWLERGALALGAIVVLSTAVYWLLGKYYHRQDWTLLNCLFMVVITLTTIGYGDWLQIKDLYAAEVYTMFLAVAGMGVPAFIISNVIGLIVEGLLSDAFRRRRMGKQMAEMRDHIIVCGIGTTGYHCVEELARTRRPFVAIDSEAERLARATHELGEFPYLVGQADNDERLREAIADWGLRIEDCGLGIADWTGDRLRRTKTCVRDNLSWQAAPQLRHAPPCCWLRPACLCPPRAAQPIPRRPRPTSRRRRRPAAREARRRTRP